MSSFSRSRVLLRILFAVALLAVSGTGCFKEPKVDASGIKQCKNNDNCPSGYACAGNGTCCKSVNGQTCDVGDASAPPTTFDGTVVDTFREVPGNDSDVGPGTGGIDGRSGSGGVAGSNEVGEIYDVPAGSGGSTGVGGTTGSGGSAGFGGTTGGGGAAQTMSDAAVGSGGAVASDASSPDAPGSCSADKDCPTPDPLCLGGRCGKCGSNADCAGRANAVCAPSGLCVACNSSSDCKGAASTCDTATNRCVGCTKRSDCAGACQACSSNTCVAVKNQDDPTACTGTCDATGACKSRQGQTCKVSADCVDGLPCADGYCCDKACTGTCEACDLGTAAGTCTTLALNATPHAGHGSCTAADATCAGKCDGSNASCTYPTGQCGASSCTGTTYQAAGKCSAGACVMPATQACPANQTCADNGCVCQAPSLVCSGSCVDAQNDSKNCGNCGHDCLGGTCSGGLCQPQLLAEVAVGGWEIAATFMISGTSIILEVGGRGMASDAFRVWAVDVNGAGPVGVRRGLSSGITATRTVALDGKLYWISYSGSSAQLIACPQTNCTDASFVTVAARDGGTGTTMSASAIVADPSAHEVVWQEYVYANPVYTYSVVRSGSQGPARATTSFPLLPYPDWKTPNNRPERYFWESYDNSAGTRTYYYVATSTAAALPVAITGPMTTSGFPSFLANDTTVFVVSYPYPSYEVASIPLPNGVAGTPPKAYTGEAYWQAVDAQYAYGQKTGAATDGVWRCSLSNCNPTYLARSFLQGSVDYFLLDDKALYLLERPSGGAWFKVWKLAK